MEARAAVSVEAVTVAGSEAAAPVVVRVAWAAARAAAVAHTRCSKSCMPTICQCKMMGRLHNSYQ